MKSRIILILALVLLFVPIFTACDTPWDIAEDIIDDRLDHIEDSVENRIENKGNDTQNLTLAEAEEIALDHAGLTADEVSGLRTEYDIDDGISKYEVRFYQGYAEYEYDIHAGTGAILSFEKDDR